MIVDLGGSEFALSTPGLFDIGVYFVVFGTMSAVALALESDREEQLMEVALALLVGLFVAAGDLPAAVARADPHAARLRAPRQRRQPADLRRRPADARGPADRAAPGSRRPPAAVANPLPQALILTAIVIGFAMFAFLLVLAYRAYQALDADDTDSMRLAEPKGGPTPPLELLMRAPSATPAADWVIILPVVLPLLGAALLLMLRSARDFVVGLCARSSWR